MNVEKTETKSNVPPVNALNSLFSPKSPTSNNRSFAGSMKIVKNENWTEEKREEGALSPSQLDPFFQEGGEVSGISLKKPFLTRQNTGRY